MSKRANFRPRSKLSFQDDEEENTPEPTPAPAVTAKPASKPAAAQSKASLLSFDEDADVGGASKKKEKSKPKFGRAQGLPELSTAAAAPPASTGEYTAERLKELQKNTISFSSSRFAASQGDGPAAGLGSAAPAQPELPTLKGSFKPAGAVKDDGRFSIEPIAVVKPSGPSSAGRADTSLERPSARSSKASNNAAQRQQPAVPAKGVPSEGGEDEEDDEDGIVIPDADTIRLAKAKREVLRKAQLAPDYIPLGGVSRLLSRSKAGSASGGALAAGAEDREPVELGSGSDAEADLEDQMRLKFTVKGETRASEQKQYARTLAVDEDDDEDAFAREQLRKAVRRQHAARDSAAAAAATTQAQAEAGQQGGDAYGGLSSSAAGATAAARALGALGRSRQEAITSLAQSVLASLQDGVARLAASHKATQSNLDRTTNNLSGSLVKAEALDKDLKGASEKYIYVQKARAYIADLVDCLAHKSALVEELEESLMDLREDRAQAGRQGAQALEEELLRVGNAGVQAAIGVLGRGGTLQAASAAAAAAAKVCEEELVDEAAGGPDEVDEFGRSLNLGRRREAEQRRRQRAAAIERETSLLAAMAGGAPLPTDSGDPAGDEDAGQVERYEGRHQEIIEVASSVFADASDEFASLGAVKQRLEEFKLQYPREYGSAYMHLSTPALFAPYVRLELLRWDPLFADASTPSSAPGAGANGSTALAIQPREGVTRSFEKQAWYEGLFEYGVRGDPPSLAPDDPDADLVPQLVTKLVLPLAAHMLGRCWDPLNVRQSAAVAAIVGDLCVYVPPDDERMGKVISSLLTTLEETAARCSVPPWPPAATSASPLAEAVLSRRFRAAVRVLKCIGSFDGLLSRPMLTSLALGKVVGGQLLAYLRTAAASASQDPAAAVARLEAVVTALPQVWFQGVEPQDAAPLIELCSAVARALEAQWAPRGTHGPLALRLATAMARLGQRERAASLALAFGLQLKL